MASWPRRRMRRQSGRQAARRSRDHVDKLSGERYGSRNCQSSAFAAVLRKPETAVVPGIGSPRWRWWSRGLDCRSTIFTATRCWCSRRCRSLPAVFRGGRDLVRGCRQSSLPRSSARHCCRRRGSRRGTTSSLSTGALARCSAELPADAFRVMAAEFDTRYPLERRCDPRASGCWRSGGFPDHAYAFSADAIYDRASYSRRVTDIDFADPVWLRLGFVNEAQIQLDRNQRPSAQRS